MANTVLDIKNKNIHFYDQEISNCYPGRQQRAVLVNILFWHSLFWLLLCGNFIRMLSTAVTF